MRGIRLLQILLILLLLGAAVVAAPAQPEVTLTAQDGGGYLVTAPEYTARLAADGNLHSLRVRGVELLDDTVPGSAGASFFLEKPIALPKMKQELAVVTASDGVFSARYEFFPGYFTLALRQTSAKNAAFITVCSDDVAYVENTDVTLTAATPAEGDWKNVRLITPTGEFLKVSDGTRIWGRGLGRQVWELSNILPEKKAPKTGYLLTFVPGVGKPPRLSLDQLTQITPTLNRPDQLIPAGEQGELRVRFENLSNQAIAAEMTVRVESSRGVMLMNAKAPLACEPHTTVNFTWPLTPATPDFYTVTCSVNLDGANTRQAVTTFGYAVPTIKPISKRPADFDAYWERVRKDAAEAAVTVTRTAVPERSKGGVQVSRLTIDAGKATFYGWLAVPKYPGRYPGLLQLPAERVRYIRPNESLAELGFVVMTIEPTGQPIDGAFQPLINRTLNDLDDPAKFGLRQVMVRNLQALTAMAALPEVDPNRIAATGVSLGGTMALMLGALDERVQAVAPDVPYYCDIPYGMDKPTWPYPELAAYLRKTPEKKDAVLKTLSYYDAVNFADRLTCPVFMGAGINDSYARPTPIYALYNALPGPHTIKLYLSDHLGGGAKHWEAKMQWLSLVLGEPGALPVRPPTPADVAPVVQ